MLIPIGFWSYTSSDNTSSGEKLSKLRTALVNELQQQIGREPKVSIFEDSVEISPGREWEMRVRLAIKTSSFLIPIITPGFLQSEWCCREVELFRQREKELGRSDLIFPIHYVDTDYVTGDDPAYCKDAEVLRFLRTRQWVNFRPLRKKSLESEDVELKLEEIARAIATALRVVVGARKDVPTAPKSAEAAPAAKPRRNLLFSSVSRKDREETMARSYGASWADLHSEAADRYPLDTGLEDQPPATFEDAWPQPKRARSDALRRTRRPSTFAEPAAAAPTPDRPPVADRPVVRSEEPPPVTVLKSGVVDGMAYSLYSDGSIEAQMPEGMMRFASIDELRSHLDQRP